jgi:hypothetical protein
MKKPFTKKCRQKKPYGKKTHTVLTCSDFIVQALENSQWFFILYNCKEYQPPIKLSIAQSIIKMQPANKLRSVHKNGAGDQTRTGDNHVGNVELYQLSYTRSQIHETPKGVSSIRRKLI